MEPLAPPSPEKRFKLTRYDLCHCPACKPDEYRQTAQGTVSRDPEPPADQEPAHQR